MRNNTKNLQVGVPLSLSLHIKVLSQRAFSFKSNIKILVSRETFENSRENITKFK